jgi:hypothetical protein
MRRPFAFVPRLFPPWSLPLVPLLLALAGPPTARAEDLKLATWNIDWLTLRPVNDPELPPDIVARRPEDIEALRHYAETLAADVIAFEGIDGPDAAARVFPAGRYVLHTTSDGTAASRVGFAIRAGLTFTANPDVVALAANPGGRPLRSGADVTLDLPGGRLRLLAVHLKAGCRNEPLSDDTRPACAVLRAQLGPLQAWIAARQAEGVAYAVLGAFNRWLDGRDPFYTALAATAPLKLATTGRSNPCWGGGRFSDQILAGGPARGWVQPESLRVLVFRETDPEWKQRLSPHCPVSVRLHLPEGSATGGSTSPWPSPQSPRPPAAATDTSKQPTG